MNPSSQPPHPALELAYRQGQAAFERGEYRQAVQQLEQAAALTNPGTPLDGEVQMWLVTAYEAAGLREEALALCRAVSRHPDWQSRQQGKRLLYILEAPKLQIKPEWMSQIPDLSHLDDGDGRGGAGRVASSRSRRPVVEDKPYQMPSAPDPTQVDTRDNQFVWVGLGTGLLILVGLVWWSGMGG